MTANLPTPPPPKVSVIIPTYNRAHLLRRAVLSVQAQTLPDWELIVVDDCSTEDIAGALAEFDDRRIRLIRHPVNRGAPAARNTGIASASAPWIAFLDSDDEWLPEKLARQWRLVRGGADAPLLIYSGFEKVGWPRQPSPPTRRGHVLIDLLEENFVGTCSTPLVRTQALKSVGGFDIEMQSGQDWDLWLRLARLGSFDFVADTLVHYHHQPDSITMNRAAVVAGHRRLERKWSQDINKLPAPSRARHHLRIGITYYWRRAIWLMTLSFLRAIVCDPRIFVKILHFILLRRLDRPNLRKKLL